MNVRDSKIRIVIAPWHASRRFLGDLPVRHQSVETCPAPPFRQPAAGWWCREQQVPCTSPSSSSAVPCPSPQTCGADLLPSGGDARRGCVPATRSRARRAGAARASQPSTLLPPLPSAPTRDRASVCPAPAPTPRRHRRDPVRRARGLYELAPAAELEFSRLSEMLRGHASVLRRPLTRATLMLQEELSIHSDTLRSDVWNSVDRNTPAPVHRAQRLSCRFPCTV